MMEWLGGVRCRFTDCVGECGGTIERLGLLGHGLKRNMTGYGQESHRLLDDFSRHRLLGRLLLVDAPDFSHTELSLETAW